MRIPRRHFLVAGTRLAGAALVTLAANPAAMRNSPFAETAQSLQDSGLFWYSREFLTAETSIEQLRSPITRTQDFFVRNNLLMPQINLDTWRLRFSGEVAHPFELSYQELQQLSSADVSNTLECAGNGRAFFQPRISGVRWKRGAVGTAVFSGTPLRDLLLKAEVKPTARHVAFYGLDVVPEGAQQFVRSIPLAKALDANTIVATRMNHTGLMPEHGFPARALVPGWIGSCSIKWLSEIRVLKEEFQGFYMQSAYRMPRANSASQRSGPESDAITSLRVKSIITSPLDGALLPWAADITLLGAAWAGEQAIQKVEISTDGGHIWHSATLGSKSGRYAWHLWKREWNPQRPGSYLILSRATDDHGHSQPFQSKWNPGGYLWNGVDHVRVTLQA